MPILPTPPDLRALDLFVSIVELGSISRAAKAHQITQPSASSRIRSLERQLGIKLIERTAAGSQPTTEGLVIAEWATNTLSAAAELVASAHALRAEATGRLRVAASLTIAEYLLPPWLEKFLEARSRDTVSLIVRNSSAVLKLTDTKTVDIGFVECPQVPSSLNEKTVAMDELVVVVGKSHPWSTRSRITLDDFTSVPCVLREKGSGTRDSLEAALLRRGHSPPISALDLGSLSAVLIAALNGAYPTVLSRLAVQDHLAAGSLVEVEVSGLTVERRLRAIWPKGVELPPLAKAFLHQLPKISTPNTAGT